MRAGRPRERRRRPIGLLIGAIAALAVLAIVLVSLLSDSDKHHHAPSNGAAAAAGATPASSQGASSGSSTGIAAGSSAGALIGGGSVPPRAATGRLAAPNEVGAVLFAEAGTALDAPAHAVIAHAAKQIQSRHASHVRVIGYTDRLGNAVVNRTLSLRRARIVIAALRREVPNRTISYMPLAQGDSQPVASNGTPQGRQLNRRVVILDR